MRLAMGAYLTAMVRPGRGAEAVTRETQARQGRREHAYRP
jgi:hypothetical protein